MAHRAPLLKVIGVSHLAKLWARLGRPDCVQGDANAWIHDRISINGLGLSLEETHAYLMRNTLTFDEFENWVLSINSAGIPENRIARINAVLSNKPYDQDTTRHILELENS